MNPTIVRSLVALLLVWSIAGLEPANVTGAPRNSADRNEARKKAARERQKKREEQDKRKAMAARQQARKTVTPKKPTRTLTRDRDSSGPRMQVMSNAPSVATPAAAQPVLSAQQRHDQMPVLREFLQTLTPEERQKVIAYSGTLTLSERQSMRELLISTPPGERKEVILGLIERNEKPAAPKEIMNMVGVAPPVQSTPMVIASKSEGKMEIMSAGTGEKVPLPKVGRRFPDISLETIQGPLFSSRQSRGKPLVIEFGSLTCPVYRTKISEMNSVASRHPEAEFVVIYTIEAHPTGSKSPYADREWVPLKNYEQGYLKPQTSTLQDRKQNAAELVKLGERRHIAIDQMDNPVWTQLGARTNEAIIVDASGRIVLAQEWSDPQAIDKALDELKNQVTQ